MEFTVGRWTFWHIQTHKFALDGGAMFGVVPRVLWEKKIPPDDQNRIPMGTNLLLVKTEKDLVLVDTGLGERWDEKGKRIYAIQPQDPWQNLPYGPEDVTVVILTHLHFDHARGAVDRNLKPAFPNARYYVQRDDFYEALHPNERNRASYSPDDFLPLGSQLHLLDGDQEIVPGVFVIKTAGHTAGHQIVRFAPGDREVYFVADFIPTIHHAALPYIMAYDLYPMDSLRKRRELYPLFMEREALLVFEHDAEPRQGFLTFDGKRHSVRLFEP